jgi:hypothetical protein
MYSTSDINQKHWKPSFQWDIPENELNMGHAASIFIWQRMSLFWQVYEHLVCPCLTSALERQAISNRRIERCDEASCWYFIVSWPLTIFCYRSKWCRHDMHSILTRFVLCRYHRSAQAMPNSSQLWNQPNNKSTWSKYFGLKQEFPTNALLIVFDFARRRIFSPWV